MFLTFGEEGVGRVTFSSAFNCYLIITFTSLLHTFTHLIITLTSSLHTIRFRQRVSQLFDASQASRDWASSVSSTFSVTVRRETLVQDALEVLQQVRSCVVRSCDVVVRSCDVGVVW